jgi:hypothetical protein
MSTGAVADAPKLLAEMVYSGMFDRFPRLQMVFGEVNVGWVPLVLESMDDHYNRDRIWTRTELARMPSSYWRPTSPRRSSSTSSGSAIAI